MNRLLTFFTTLIVFVLLIGLILIRDTPSDEFQTSDPTNGSLPGIGQFSESLLSQMDRMREFRGPAKQLPMRHLEGKEPKFTNRLFLESSPYLLQHAHNPINWFPWGNEAFAIAKRLNRPVLLSVGYSTCHWCHIMEEESFEDLEIARYINQNYIAIKVDREERPDIDSIYMAAVQAMNGEGGWPMTVWLTPQREPFYAGSYFPARDGDRGIQLGLLTLLKKLLETYHQNSETIAQSSQILTAAIDSMLSSRSLSTTINTKTLSDIAKVYIELWDYQYGGFKGNPKFPSHYPLRFLLRYHRRSGDQSGLKATLTTLNNMTLGGIYDQVGGGFHRYSTDESWNIPHFEKMLYGNALLIFAYLEAYQVTHNDNYKSVVENTLSYVENEMTSPQGGFYSAQDADSLNTSGIRKEGWYYTWTYEEIASLLPPAIKNQFFNFFEVSAEGNFEGRNLLHASKPLSVLPKKTRGEFQQALMSLYQARNKRTPPHRDEKILTAWNGLMISAFARSGFVLNNSNYIQKAKRSAQFIWDYLYDGNHLHRSYFEEKVRYTGFLQDYSLYIAALIDLFETTSDIKWLDRAIELESILSHHFEDHKNGGFFQTSDDQEKLITREKPNSDDELPSGNSVAALNLLRLHGLTTNDSYRLRAQKALESLSSSLGASPTSHSELLLALDYFTDESKEVVIVIPKETQSSPLLLTEILRDNFLPNRVIAIVSEADIPNYVKTIPLLSSKKVLNHRPTAYVCIKGTCRFPTNDPVVFTEQIKAINKY